VAGRPGLPLVVKDINLTIKAGEKIGIVGRTGAGKSSLSSSLLRMCEAASGSILIDGVNIAEIGLDSLRRAVEFLPQDPTLFAGTVRSNLDPFREFTDDELWTALKLVNVDARVRALGKGLESEVSAGGSNLSVGERQLMCMARSLLRQPRVLVMDESTASVDEATDALLQTTVRQAFAKTTVLAIAHRLLTIADSDRVLVLDEGRVAQFASPHELLSTPGIFQSMVDGSGDAAKVRQMAADKAAGKSAWGAGAAHKHA